MYLTGRDPAAARRDFPARRRGTDQCGCAEECWLWGLLGFGSSWQSVPKGCLCAAETQCPPAMAETPLRCSPAPVLFLGCAVIISLHETCPATELEETLFLVGSFFAPCESPGTAGECYRACLDVSLACAQQIGVGTGAG